MRNILTPLLFALALTSAIAAIRQFPTATLEKLGTAIYEQDIRAARATDLLFARGIDPEKSGLRGWVVVGDPPNLIVRFVRQHEGKLEAFYDVIFSGDRPPALSESKSIPLSPAETAQLNARSLVAKDILRPASKSYNLVTLPDPEHDGLLVYALAATTDPDAVMVGGHYRFSVSKDGTRLEQADELFRSFMVLSKRPKDLPKGSSLAALTMTTLVSDTPLETHVYLSLLHHLPFYVGTPDKHIWKVDGGRMSRIN